MGQVSVVSNILTVPQRYKTLREKTLVILTRVEPNNDPPRMSEMLSGWATGAMHVQTALKSVLQWSVKISKNDLW